MRFHHHKEKGSYRVWLYCQKERSSCAHFGLHWGRPYLCSVSIKFDDEDGWGGSLYAALFGFYGYINVPKWLRPQTKPDYKTSWSYDREISLSFHGGGMYWSVWHCPMGWSSDTPRWRNGSFNFVNFILGRHNYSERVLEERDVLVPMPEKSYQAHAKLVEATWKRPRWFSKSMKRIHVEIPEGIPHAGKGTCEWNCGDDATFGTTAPANSIPEGIGNLVGSCLRDRVRYGGWDDWSWKREDKAA